MFGDANLIDPILDKVLLWGWCVHDEEVLGLACYAQCAHMWCGLTSS